MTDTFWVIALCVAIGILAMRFAAQIFTYLIEWEPNLEHAAFALLLVISAETFLKVFAQTAALHQRRQVGKVRKLAVNNVIILVCCREVIVIQGVVHPEFVIDDNNVFDPVT